MILSTGQCVELKQIDDGQLVREEKIFHNQYKNSTQSTLSARNDSKFYTALENEINIFNRWQDLVEEMSKRDKLNRRHK